MRRSLVAAARELTVANGWDGVRMADVAAAVGVSRQTVYNEFDGKPGLAEAVVAAEVERFVATVRAALFEHGADVRAAARAAIHAVLVEGAADPLVRAILTGAPDGGLLPYLTTDGGMVLAAAGAVIREWAAEFVPEAGGDRLDAAADAVVRLTVSHLMLPAAPPGPTADALADDFVRLLAD
ncbi:TetR family transcriptional regulator [Actinoplanes bogorensis]|uniref:TetR family transcriptional regulator n=1 Tax=Paractinoplanes bogorensis TaxID=1610840 RepID=A0ABS5YKJ1_9ACTN|nr:TetR family transcriptional regulator [Actinoplanes bogorensis]